MMPRLASMMAPRRPPPPPPRPGPAPIPWLKENPEAAEVNARRARNLVAVRERAGLTQGQLGRTSGLPRGHIAYVEQGRRAFTLRMIDAIAAALKMTPAALLAELDKGVP